MSDEAGPRVIGAGLGRTGTTSLKLALEQLGFTPCHHMEAVFLNPWDVPTWERAARGESIPWARFMARWGATTDFPSALYYQALMEAFPHAKVVLTVRDPDRWYESFAYTIRDFMRVLPNRLLLPWLPLVNASYRVTQHPLVQGLLLADAETAKAEYRAWNAEVRREVPADRLLVYEVREGWEPLCRFLDVPVPDAPFPRVNSRRAFRRRVVAVQALGWCVLALPVVVTVALWAWLR